MLITLVCEEKIYSMALPEKIAGKYWIVDDEKPINNNKIFAVEANKTNDKWIVKADKKLKLYDEKKREIKEIEIKEGELLAVSLGKDQPLSFLLVESFTKDRGTYEKFMIHQDVALRIGRENDNDIVIANKYVGSYHAVLVFANGKWSLNDNGSINGIYVNKRRIHGQVDLNIGDIVFILGYKFVVGNCFIAMNNPGKSVAINTKLLSEYINEDEVDSEILELDDPTFYYRSPRFINEITPLELQVDSPTKQEDAAKTPLLLTMGPSLVMGLASFSVGLISVTNAMKENASLMSALPTMVTSVSLLIGMILFPILVRRYEKKHGKEKEQIRREKYIKYLDNLKEEIQSNITIQEELLNTNNPSVQALTDKQEFWDSGLWGKAPEQKDFLFVRLGAGNLPMYGNIKFPDDRFSIEDDVMRERLFAFQREERLLLNVPIGISLLKNRAVGIVGNREGVFQLLNNMLMQIMLLHSYDEVKIICMMEAYDEKKFPFIRYAQHTWDNEGRRRFLAVSEENLRELSMDVNKVIRERKERDKKDGAIVLPHYIILSVSAELANKCAFLSDILEDETISGFSVICAYDEVKSLPKECKTIIEVNDTQGMLYDTTTSGGGVINFAQDMVSTDYAKNLVYRMTAKRLDLNQGRYALPEMLTFLEMFGVGKIEHLNIVQRWKDNNPVKSLRAPVGVDTSGDTFYLDLHEKFHGPHGLVAGMTGSGKSEFIITYILSMAVNYHPDEVAFVLIDYKGGGLTGAFCNEHYTLPHLAGTITNLDGSAIMRSILSIKSELRKRQAIFNQARDIANEGTMDIYKYQKMYRDGLVKEPMPHLFIISDEFAELSAQQPEFMSQLISTARIGRSLGVHLILATQKPSGVVNEQIWANSKFKVCLKVQDQNDSKDMLKRPDAAEITETGRFYLQVGYNEIFEMGQSAWAGAAYLDQDVSGKELDTTIEVLDELGNVADRLKPKKSVAVTENGKQIVRIMEYLDELAKEEQIHERQLWMPEIPEVITMDELVEKYQYSVQGRKGLWTVIGEVDDPYTQSQHILDVDLSTAGNVLIYGGAGSGKELMLSSMLYFLYKNYLPEQLHTYILDFGAETFRMFESAPHTGSVMIDGEDEKINGLINMLSKEVKYRKKLFAEFSGDIERYNASDNLPVPYMLVIINNYSNFNDNYERYEEILIALTRECPKYGIYFIYTATNTTSVRFRMSQNFRQMYVMQMNDKADYSTILGSTKGVYPPAIKGRGILKTEETYVFQAAHIVREEEDLLGYIKQFAENLAEKANGKVARQIPVVPKFVSGLDAASSVNSFGQMSLGVSHATYDYLKIDATEKNVLLAISEDSTDALYYAGGLIETTSAIPEIQTIVFNGGRKLAELLDVAYEPVDTDYENKIVELFQTVLLRNNDYKDTDGHPTVDMHPMLVVLNGFEVIRNTLSEDGKDKLNTILDKAEDFWNVWFVVSDSYRNLNLYYMENWIRNKCEGKGVWIGNGIEDQMRFVITKHRSALKKEVDSRTGYYVNNGVAKIMKLVMPSKLEGMSEDEE